MCNSVAVDLAVDNNLDMGAQLAEVRRRARRLKTEADTWSKHKEEEGKFLRAAAGGFAIQQDEEMQAQREAMWQSIQGFQAPEGL